MDYSTEQCNGGTITHLLKVNRHRKLFHLTHQWNTSVCMTVLCQFHFNFIAGDFVGYSQSPVCFGLKVDRMVWIKEGYVSIVIHSVRLFKNWSLNHHFRSQLEIQLCVGCIHLQHLADIRFTFILFHTTEQLGVKGLALGHSSALLVVLGLELLIFWLASQCLYYWVTTSPSRLCVHTKTLFHYRKKLKTLQFNLNSVFR